MIYTHNESISQISQIHPSHHDIIFPSFLPFLPVIPCHIIVYKDICTYTRTHVGFKSYTPTSSGILIVCQCSTPIILLPVNCSPWISPPPKEPTA